MRVFILGTYAGSCPNHDYIAAAFRKLGHNVTELDESQVSAREVLGLLQGHDLLLCEEGRLAGDHWSTKDGVNHIEGYFQEVIDKAPCPVVPWLTNIFVGLTNREIELTTNPIFKAKIVFSTDGGHQKEFAEAGVNHVTLRQGIHLPEAVLGNPTYPTKASVVFIGSVYEHIWPYRKQLIDHLKETLGDQFEHLGNDGSIRHHALNNLCATAKIVVGDSVKSPDYWSNRIYEVIGRGGFLIHPMTDGLADEFEPYKHFIPYEYGDFKSLDQIIRYYLTHDKEREAIRLAGFEHCKKHHTYTHRVREMLDVLRERGIIPA